MKKLLLPILCICMIFTMFSNSTTVKAVETTQTIPVLKSPPMKYYLAKGVKTKKVKPFSLTQKSKKANEITDDDKWFSKNKLTMKNFRVPSPANNYETDLPGYIKLYYNDLLITNAFYDDNYTYCTYGANYGEGYILIIYDKTTKEIAYELDFSNYRYSSKYIKADYDYIQQRIIWATIKDNILYISHSHFTYAKSSYNLGSNITAIDLSNNKILWRSEPLVSNSYNFEIIDDVLITGYGFTAESDYLYQLNIYTGKVISKLSVKTSPSYIIKKGKYLYVRTYDTDYVYKFSK